MTSGHSVVGRTSGSTIKIENDDPTLTGHAGLLLTGELVRRLEVVGTIEEAVNRVRPFKQRRRGLNAGELMMSLAEMVMVGGDHLIHLDQLRGDLAGAELRAVAAPPAPTTAGQLLKRFQAGQCRAVVAAAIGGGTPELQVAYRGLLFLASHDLSLLRGLLGPAREVSSASTWHGGRWLAATLRFDDASVTYAMGSVGFRHFEEVVDLYGDEQTVSLSFPTPFLKHAPTLVTRRHADGARTIEERSVASYEEAFVRELEHFHDCVTIGRAPDPAAGEAADDAELMVAIVRAAATGRPQSVAR